MNLIDRKKIDNTIRKLKKLKRDPKLFFDDMLKKRSQQILAKIPTKYSGSNQFTVVSAVYNVEKYLDDYFKSLVNQTLDFEKHIQLILVDDGSIDSSPQIIKKWQKKYPNNIHYYRKENGGQASARNFGIDFIQTEWCTFIDPDDFVDLNYFRNIDLAIEEEKDLWMVSCNLIFYYEQSKQYKDTHPQNYKFKQKITCFDVRDEDQFIQLSVSLAILKKEIIQEYKLKFDVRIKPSFEDATFMMHYALALYEKQGKIAFLKDAKYYYRKREDGTSTLDTGWIKPSGYDEVLRYGCLQTFKDYDVALGFVPRFIQIAVMYYHIWQIHGIVNQSNALNFLTEQQKATYLTLLREVFTYIDEDTIDQFSLASAWFFEKAGMLNLYKGRAPAADKQIIYTEKYDAHKNEVLMYYFAPKDSQATFYNDGIAIESSYKKILRHSFLSEAFVYEYRYWIPLTQTGALTVEVDGNPTKIGFAGQHVRTPVPMAKIREHYLAQYIYPNDEDSWVIMDRDVQADDNAEHFYRYLIQQQPQQKAYFALRRNSHDWQRLEAEGFNLLAFGTPKFEEVLKKCSKIISSHIDDYIVNYFGDGGLKGKDFVFLPHGVTQNDLHSWYNSKLQYMSLMAVASYDEYHSIADDNNHYKYGQKEIKLTGFPRHDALLRGNQYGTKRIVVMPTWRKYLLGKFDTQTGTFAKNKDFMQSEYAKRWQSFLQSDVLQKLMKQYGYEVVFAPHKNTEVYLNDFKLPENIQIWQANPNESIQKLFQTSDVMITDYSSVAFEMGYLGKSVLYYQFDFDDFFSDQWQRGYFEYEKHGFGAVAHEEEKLLSDLQAILTNDGKPLLEYQHRIERTFAYRDDKSCERVYEAILALDEKPSSQFQNETVFHAMNQLYEQENYVSSQRHAEFLLNIDNLEDISDSQKALSVHVLFNSLINQQQIARASAVGKQYHEWLNHSDCIKLAYWLAEWQQVIALTAKSVSESQNESWMLQYAQIELDLPFSDQKFPISLPKLEEWQNKAELSESDILPVMQTTLAWAEEKAWQKMVQQLPEFIDYLMETEPKWLAYYPIQLLLAKAYRSLEEYELANQQLDNYEQHTQDDVKGHLEIARLANAREDWVKCIRQYQQAMNNQMENLLLVDKERYISALLEQQNQEQLNKWLPIFLLQQPDNQTFVLAHAYQLIEEKNWQDFLVLYPKLQIKEQQILQYFELLTKYRLGMLEQIKFIRKPVYQDSYEYHLLVMEIAFMQEDSALFKYCYQQIAAIYPEKHEELTKKCSELMQFHHLMKNFS